MLISWVSIIHTVCLFLAALSATNSATLNETVNISIPLGRITGMKVPVLGSSKMVYQFLGIPYAKAPVENLRFAKPEPFGGWNGTLDGRNFGSSCIQIVDPFLDEVIPNQSEDCLFLNIYVPNSIKDSNKKSVMVWIHGGAFIYGTSTLYDGSFLAAKGDVIVVTMNYRLGIFGFLSLGSKSPTRGNYGLWDQILALKWINSYITYFGGDPRSVTLFGQSSGGFSASLHSIIPSNQGLFHRVISQSGVSNSLLATTTSSQFSSSFIGFELSCYTATVNPSKFLSCLRSKNVSNIIQTIERVKKYFFGRFHFIPPFGPTIDNELLFETPANLLSSNSSNELDFFKSLDIMVGNCDMEGSVILQVMPTILRRHNININDGLSFDFFKENFVSAIVNDHFFRISEVSDTIISEYGVMNNPFEQATQLLQSYADLFFITPSVVNIDFHAHNNTQGNTYFYVFSRQSPKPYGPERPPWYQGAGHTSEIHYLFGIEKLSPDIYPVTKQDLMLSDQVKIYWTNFAKFG